MNIQTDFVDRQATTTMKARLERFPIVSAVILFALDLLLGAVSGILAKALLPEADPAFVAMCVLAVAIAGLLTLLRWWREAGFNGRSQWRELRLLWLPAFVAIVLPLFGGFKEVDPRLVIYLTIGYLITGFMEEAWVRGLILRVLQPVGPVRAVLISALLFALLHVTNFLFRDPAIVLAQMVGAFCFGVAFGALRLRTNTIWFLIALHMLHDLLLHLSGFPTIPLNVVQDVILLIYGIYLLRGLRQGMQPGGEPGEDPQSTPQFVG